MNKIILSFFILAISGCNTGQYQSYQSGVGYLSEQQDENIFYVTYTGTRTTKVEKVNDFALLRSAELTLEKGFNYFVITIAKNNKLAAGARQTTFMSMDRAAPNLTLTAGTAELSGARAKSELTIVMYHEKPETIAYNARQIDQALKDEYQINNSN